MTFPDLLPQLKSALPDLRGRLLGNEPLAPLTWFRVGGAAQALFMQEDEDDLAYLLANLPREIPVTVIGLGSNLIVRDGGVEGVVIRLGRGFNQISVEEGHRVRAGTAAPDQRVAKASLDAGVAGLAFLRGIPGAIGGALRMNGGAYGREVRDVLLSARIALRTGEIVDWPLEQLGYTYRHSEVPEGAVVVEATFRGTPGDPAAIGAEMDAIARAREESQPLRSRTGGSTFKNPPGHKAWALVDAAGCRGLTMGDAQVSEKHTNFLINTGEASAAELEALGEDVRKRVKEKSGIELEWEIKRVGVPGERL